MKKKSLKSVLALMLIAPLAFVFAGCGSMSMPNMPWEKSSSNSSPKQNNGGNGQVILDPSQSVSFAVDSPALIKHIGDLGLAQEYYNIGDERDITLTTGETITMQIWGFDHDDKSDGTGKASMTLGMKDLLATKYRMHDEYTNIGGYSITEMRTQTLPAIFAQFPQEWKNVIETVDKVSLTDGYASDATTVCSDKLFLFSEYEIRGIIPGGMGYIVLEGQFYEYWELNNTNQARIKRYASGSAGQYWMRTTNINSVVGYRLISTSGSGALSLGAGDGQGVCFGFCV